MPNGDDVTPAGGVADGEDVGSPDTDADSGRRRRVLAIALGVVAIGLVIVLAVLLLSDNSSDDKVSSASRSVTTSTSTTSTTVPVTTTLPLSTAPNTTAATAPPATTSGGTTATTSAPGPVITSYTSSTTSIACPAGDVSTSVGPPSITLSWTTEHATGVDLGVDGPGVYASYGPSGTTQLTVPCDGNTHTYKLTAKGTGGQTASQTISVATHT